MAIALRDTGVVIAIAIAVLVALVVLVRFLPQFLPRVVFLLLPAATRVAITRVPGLIARLQARQAANESVFRRVVGL